MSTFLFQSAGPAPGMPSAAEDAPGRPSAGADAVDRLLLVEPAWQALCQAKEAVGIEEKHLLHAGPPLPDPSAPPATILNAAVIACLYEGWADSDDAAERLIRSGAVRLSPAQNRSVVTPLAAVVSPSMPLQVVADMRDPSRRAFAPLGSGTGPQLRFGARDPDIVERLRWREAILARVLEQALTENIPLLPIAAAGIGSGDDLHGRTTSATHVLREVLAARIGGEPGFMEVQSHIEQWPLFFLSLWMAACKCILMAAEGAEGSTLVTSMAGNGQTFGVRLAGNPDEWLTCDARSPAGPMLSSNADVRPSGAIGDSAIVDALGFGGQCVAHSPETMSLLGPFLPRGVADLPDRLLCAPHPAFGDLGIRVGLDAARVIATGASPVVTLTIIDAAGRGGLLGRGCYQPPVSLFSDAVRRVAEGIGGA